MMCHDEYDPVDEARREAWADPPEHDEVPSRSDFDGDDTSDDALAYRAQLPLAERGEAVRAAVSR